MWEVLACPAALLYEALHTVESVRLGENHSETHTKLDWASVQTGPRAVHHNPRGPAK